MKTPSDILFRLIKSMNKLEKRYFKRFSQQHLLGKKKRYIKLFDLIKDQEEYDEIEVLKKIKDNSFSKNLAEHKRYLYQQVLKSLRNYESKKSVCLQLRKVLMNVELLYKREMYDCALDLIEDSLKTAEKYELYIISQSLLFYQVKIGFERRDHNYWGNYLSENHKDKLKSLYGLKMHEYIQLKITHNLMFKGETKDYSIDLKEYPIDDFYTTLIYYNSQAAISVDLGDIQSTYKYRKKIHDYFLEQPHFIEEQMYIYVTNSFRYASCCEELGKEEEGLVATNQMIEQIVLLYKNDKITDEQYLEAISLIYSANILLNARLRDLRGVEKYYLLMKEKNLTQQNKGANNIYKRLLYVNVIAQLLLGLYDEAMDMIYEFNNHKQSKAYTRDEGIIRMLSVLVNYEKGNFLLLQNLVDSTYSFLRSRNLLGDFEKLFLSFLKNKVLKTNFQRKKELKKEFIIFKKQVQALNAKKLEIRMPLKTFDLELWAESKIQDCTMQYLLIQYQEEEK